MDYGKGVNQIVQIVANKLNGAVSIAKVVHKKEKRITVGEVA